MCAWCFLTPTRLSALVIYSLAALDSNLLILSPPKLRLFCKLETLRGQVKANRHGEYSPNCAESPEGKMLQTKIEQAWMDWVRKERKGVDQILADDAIEIWADGSGPHDKKATLDGMESMNIEMYVLSDFKFVPLGDGAELARYRAAVQFHGSPEKYNLAVSEVWQKRGAEWKLVHYQETEVK